MKITHVHVPAKKEPIKLGKENYTCVHALAVIRSGKRGREKIIYNLFFPKQPTFFLPKPDAHMRASGKEKKKESDVALCTRIRSILASFVGMLLHNNHFYEPNI